MPAELMETSGRLTPADLRAERFWNAAPWLALGLITIVPPIALGLVVYVALCRWRSPELVQDIRQARAQRRSSSEGASVQSA